MERICGYVDCGRSHYARNFCHAHYSQLRRGRELRPLQHHVRGSVRERLDAHTDKSGECWEWTAAKNWKGYGEIRVGRSNQRAHRVAVELDRGPIPPGMVVDHMCHNPGCVRPAHLQIVTPKQNEENRIGAQSNSASGVRGVTWYRRYRKWSADVKHHGVRIHVGYFASISDAECAVIAKRNELFTNNLQDRARKEQS